MKPKTKSILLIALVLIGIIFLSLYLFGNFEDGSIFYDILIIVGAILFFGASYLEKDDN